MGRRMCGRSGLLDYGFRQYSPEVGRFMGVDPLAGEYVWMNGYNYTLNNPVLLIDPDGRSISPPDDHVFDSQGNHLYTVENDLPDRFFIEEDYQTYGDDRDMLLNPQSIEISLNSNLGHMARTIYAEGAGQSMESKVALGEVIRNRANDNTAPGSANNYNAQFSNVSTYEEVVTQPGQFESVITGSPRYTNVLSQIGGDGPGGSSRNQIRTTAFLQSIGAAINVDRQQTNTAQGATHFFSPYIPTPPWASTMTSISITGVSNKDFKFYRY